MGSGITYARRYGLMALLCIATDDDDGNAAVQSAPAAAPAKKAAPKVDAEKVIAAGRAFASKGTEALRGWYKALPTDERGAVDADDLNALKVIAGLADKKDDAQ